MSKSKDAEAETAILTYLNKQNRPYSATDIFTNLHKAYGKTAVGKALDMLSERGAIREKTYGKQKVYVADQSQFEEVPDAMLKEMDQQIVQLNEQLKVTHAANSRLDSQLGGLNNAITTEEAEQKVSETSQKIDAAKTKLKGLKENSNSVSPVERQRIMTTRTKYVKEWRKRKRMTNDILSAILEGYPKTKKDLYEDAGIETDEDYKVAPPEL